MLWERECLLLTLQSWNKYTKRQKQKIDDKAHTLGIRVLLRHYFHCWNDNHHILTKKNDILVDFMQKRINELRLSLDYIKWFDYSRSRGKRMRIVRRYWCTWITNARKRSNNRKSFQNTRIAIQMTRKSTLISRWHFVLYRRLERQCQQKQIIRQYFENNQSIILFMISFWIPQALPSFCWKTVSYFILMK